MKKIITLFVLLTIIFYIDSQIVIADSTDKKNQTIFYNSDYETMSMDSDLQMMVYASTELTYSSDNTSVVTVNDKGYVVPKGLGEAVITIKAVETEEYYEAVVRINISVVKVDFEPIINGDDFELNVGSQMCLIYGYCGCEQPQYEYFFSTPGIVDVCENGDIIALAPGESDVTIVALEGNYHNSVSKTVHFKVVQLEDMITQTTPSNDMVTTAFTEESDTKTTEIWTTEADTKSEGESAHNEGQNESQSENQNENKNESHESVNESINEIDGNTGKNTNNTFFIITIIILVIFIILVFLLLLIIIKKNLMQKKESNEEE